jgi:hypothetical protein
LGEYGKYRDLMADREFQAIRDEDVRLRGNHLVNHEFVKRIHRRYKEKGI